MEKILYLAHTDENGSLPKVALENLTAARQLADQLSASLTVGVVGKNAEAAVKSITNTKAENYYSVSGEEFYHPRYASDVAATSEIYKNSDASIVIAPRTSRWSRALPGMTAQVKGQIDTGISKILAEGDQLSVERWYYRQRFYAHLKREKRPWVLLVEGGSYSAWEMGEEAGNIQEINVALTPEQTLTTCVGTEAATAGGQTTIRPDAEMLFVAGAGWTKKQKDNEIHIKEAEQIITNFLETTQSSLGSSKSLVDQSEDGQEILTFMSHVNQVGQTGSTPRHPKGLATCCHGEEPHVVGWRFIKERRAINTNENCGWAQGKADKLYVADAFEVMSKVNEILKGQ